jgi:hypothetical protein
VASVFGQVQVERWDAPLLRLPDRDAVRDYLIARFVPPTHAVAAAGRSPHGRPSPDAAP